MFTNQKVLGAILIIFVIGAATYFTYTKFKQEISSVSVSPSPSPASLEFILSKTPAPSSQQSEPELPLSRNKRLSGFPGILKPEVCKTKKQ